MRIKTCASLLSLAVAASCATDPVTGPPPVTELPSSNLVTDSRPALGDLHARPIAPPRIPGRERAR